jgi:predicted ATPase/DNA-binding CsgD family transcriptional regulator
MATAHLPPQLTSFVGRTDDVVEIVTLLADPACRLLTLVGPGGIGKTRLAIQAAAEAQSHFKDGVCFVALQPVSSTDFLVPALADALHLTLYGPESPRSQLFHYLRPKELLLVLDNLEHLLDGVALLTEILEGAPQIKLLVTSREALNVREEWVRAVTAMRVPDDEGAVDLEGYDAAQLFVERARQARGDFMVDREHPHVIRICRLVGGLPLAIELAAARVRTMSCAQIAEEIQRSMGFLSTALRNVPERHRDMYAVLEPSWNRLTPPQREVFERLSVFRGGFEREAAERVAGASLQLLTALVDKSLLRVTSTGRYEMHELVRQYAEARLLEEPPGENERAQDSHCTYYADFLQQREPDLHGADLLRALAEIRPEIDNIRVMWQWAVEHGRWDAVSGCLDSLGFVYQNRAAWREGADAFGSAVDALGDEPSILLGRLLMWQGHMICGTDHGEQAHQRLNKAVTILGDTGLYHADPLSYQHLLCYCNQPADIEQMERLFLSTLAEYRAEGDSWHVANMLVWLEVLAETKDDFKQAEACVSEALALYRGVGNLWGISSALHGMHGIAFLQERYEEARRFAQECMACCEAIDDQPGVAIALFREGQACYALREYKTAKHLFEKSLRTINDRLQGLDPTDLLWIDVLVAIDCRLGNHDQARTGLQAALKVRRERRLDPRLAAQTLSIAARWLAATGQSARAVEVLTAALPWLTTWVLVCTEGQELLADLEAQLPPDEFAAARARGEVHDLDAIVAAILEKLEAWDEYPSLVGGTRRRPGQPLMDPLSERELEVLQLAAEGLSNREIAQELVVTVGTVKKHLNNIFSKLHVRSRTQAVVWARELDLLS